MNTSEKVDKIAPAIVAAQAKLKPLLKGNVNPHFKSAYANLPAVLDACRDTLNAEGIAVIQLPVPSEAGTLELETVLMHSSGQWIGGTMRMPLPKNDPQGFGSAYTYARRYALASVVGLAPEDDDDGNAATAPAAPAKAPSAPVKPPAPADPPVDWEKWKVAFSAVLVGLGANAQAALEGAGIPFDPSLNLYRLMEDSEKRRIYAVAKGIK